MGVLGMIDGAGRELRDVWDDAFRDGPPSPRALGSVAAVVVGVVLIFICEPGITRYAATGVVSLILVIALIELWIEARRGRNAGSSDELNTPDGTEKVR